MSFLSLHQVAHLTSCGFLNTTGKKKSPLGPIPFSLSFDFRGLFSWLSCAALICCQAYVALISLLGTHLDAKK